MGVIKLLLLAASIAAVAGAANAAGAHLTCRIYTVSQNSSRPTTGPRILKITLDDATGDMTSETDEFEIRSTGQSAGLVQARIWDAGSDGKLLHGRTTLSPGAILFQKSSNSIVIEAKYSDTLMDMEIGDCAPN